jgi:hypothetical protein
VQILVELAVREAAMLATLFALGAGPAAFLPADLGRAVRVLLAPALGFCVGTCLFTTLIWQFPAEKTAWLLPLAALGSLALSAWRLRHLGRTTERSTGRTAGPGPARRGVVVTVLQVAVVCLAVVGPTSAVLAAHSSVGPVAYKVADVDGFVMQTDAMVHQSLSVARGAAAQQNADLVQQFWAHDATGYGWPLEASPLSAALDVLLGLGATATQAPFLLAFLLTGAFGAFAAVRYAVRRRSWAAVLAGSLFGGGLFLELFFDGTEPVLGAVTVLAALVLVGGVTVARPRPANLVLTALLLATITSMLPLFLAPIAVATVCALTVLLWRRVRTGPAIVPRELGAAVARGAAVVVLPFFLNPVGMYTGAIALARQSGLVSSLPHYDLDPWTALGWLVQSRGLYALGGGSWLAIVGFAVVVPLAVVAAIVAASRTTEQSQAIVRVAVPLAGASVLVGLYGLYGYRSGGASCSYCMERGLDPAAVAVPVLLGIGLAKLAASSSTARRAAGAAVLVLVVAGAGWTATRELQQFASGSYYLDSTVRAVVAHLPATGCTVLEGFGDAVPLPPTEQVLVYTLADEQAPGRVRLESDFDEFASLEYFAFSEADTPSNAWFCAGYSDVLTRAATVDTGRTVVYRSGQVALERRSGALAALIDGGVIVYRPDHDATPDVYLLPPGTGAAGRLQLVVSGAPAGTVYVGVRLVLPSAAAARAAAASTTSAGLGSANAVGANLDVCLVSRSGPAVRELSLHVTTRYSALLAAYGTSATSCPSSYG